MFLGLQWFKTAFGFQEADYASTRDQFLQDMRADEANGGLVVGGGRVGEWGFLRLDELRERAQRKLAEHTLRAEGTHTTLEHVVGDVGALHASYPNAMFQAASQYNCLEFVDAQQTPEDGIACYADDCTQGPVCAIACPYATAFRNYVVECGGGQGQTGRRQLNALEDLAKALGNEGDRYWSLTNGYVDSCNARLAELDKVLAAKDAEEVRRLKDAVRVGVHCGAEVGRYSGEEARVFVGQTFCAAPAVSYSATSDAPAWSAFSRLLLPAAYEATLWAAILNHDFTRPAPPTVFLTKLGGGAFGNDVEWIVHGMREGIRAFTEETGMAVPMDIKVVHYGAAEAPFLEASYPNTVEAMPAKK